MHTCGMRFTYSDFHESERCITLIFYAVRHPMGASTARPNPALTAPRILKGRKPGQSPRYAPNFVTRAAGSP